MNTKLIFWTFYIFIAIIIAFHLISYVNNQYTNTGFIRDYTARDLSLFFDTTQSAKGSLFIDYETNTFKFNIDNKYVYVEDPELNAISKYPYTVFNKKPLNFDKELILCRINFNYSNNNLIIKEGECS